MALWRKWHLCCVAVCVLSVAKPAPVLAESDDFWEIFDGDNWYWADSLQHPLYSVAVFGGEGSRQPWDDMITEPWTIEGSGDWLVALAGNRVLGWYKDQLSIEVEGTVGYHFDRQTYYEFGLGIYARWHDFPWNDHVLTTLAVGTGPSYTTEYPILEVENESEPGAGSKWLNQLNVEATLALPRYPTTALLLRFQHRSGMFGLINDVHDGMSFVTIGLRQGF
jgi:hypothetical protein